MHRPEQACNSRRQVVAALFQVKKVLSNQVLVVQILYDEFVPLTAGKPLFAPRKSLQFLEHRLKVSTHYLTNREHGPHLISFTFAMVKSCFLSYFTDATSWYFPPVLGPKIIPPGTAEVASPFHFSSHMLDPFL